nr:hypothetical transcript [Hymenolepis microstoma]
MHETGLDGFKFERREDLIHQYNVQSISENAPILPILLDSVANQSVDPSTLHKAVVLDKESNNENFNPNNGRIIEIHDMNYSHFPDSLSNDLHNRDPSPPQHSIASPTRSGAFESGRSLNDRDSYSENRQSQLQSQKSSSPIPLSDKKVLSANAPSVSVPVSNAPTQNKFIGVDRIFQPQTQQGDNDAYSDSHSSETDNNLHSAGSVVSPTYYRYTGGRAATMILVVRTLTPRQLQDVFVGRDL